MALRLSASLGELDKLACCISVSDTTLANYMDTLPPSVATLHSQLALARQRILLLESENAFFREEVDNLQRNASFLFAEISVLQLTLDYVKQSKIARLPLPDKEKVFQLEKRLADYQIIMHALAEGLGLDPNTIESTLSGIRYGRESESALVNAIQLRPEKHIAAVNLILDTRKDLHNMERLAQFWKARATSTRPVAFYRHMASLPPGSIAEVPSAVSSPDRPPLLVPTPSRYSKESAPRGITSSSRSLRCSHSDGVKSSANRSIRKVRTGYVRRVASHDFKSLDIQVPEKRHGFIMPCIKSSGANEHSSAPANESHNAGASSVAPSTTMPSYGLNSTCRVSLRTTRIFQSAERLCATFSSGSLGSLEASTLSEPNTDTVLDAFPDDSQSPQDLIVIGIPTSVDLRDIASTNLEPNSVPGYSDQIKSTDNAKRIDDRDSTCPRWKNVQRRGSEDSSVPSPTSIKSTETHRVSPPSARATTSRALTSQPGARTARLCRTGVSAYQQKSGQSYSNQIRAAPPSLRLHISSSSNLTRTPQQTPNSGFTLKSALAKPSTVAWEIPQRPPLVTPDHETRKHLPSSSKTRSRLRVVNNGTQGELSSNEALPSKLSARQRHPRPDIPAPEKNVPKSTGVRDGDPHSQLVSRGRSERDKPIASISGTTGVAGRDLGHILSAKAKTAVVDGRRTKRT